MVEVQLNSTDKSYGGFQFEVTLPKGVALVKVEKAARLTAIENYTLQKNLTDAENNIYTVLGYNTDRQSIAGTSGAVAYLTLEASTSMTIGNVLNASVNNVVLSTVNEENIDAANSSFTITIGEPGDNRTILDETSTTAPAASNGAVDVRVKRTIKGGEWGTICLPFAMSETQVKAAFGSDVQIANFTSWKSEEDDGGAIVGINVGFTAVSEMEANHPYIIKTSADITEFTADGVDIEVEDEPKVQVGKKSSERGYMYGTFKVMKVPEENLFLSGGDFWYSTGTTTTKAFRGYFEFRDVLDAYYDQSNARITMTFTDEASGVQLVEISGKQDDSTYDLQGRRVVKPAGGLYIKGGKKVIVK